MQKVRTPDERFANLPDYPFEPNYIEVDDLDGATLRMHYLDEGPTDGPVVLCLHGTPTWSYLYRKMIPLLVDAGCRVIVPDLVGFGRSDKPTRQSDYTYASHVAWLTDLVTQLGLASITMFCQDWGGLIGLRMAAESPDPFAAVIAANTGLEDASDVAEQQRDEVAAAIEAHYANLPVPDSLPEMLQAMASDESGHGFLNWVKFAEQGPSFSVGALVTMFGAPLSDVEAAAYDAPFPDETYMAGVRVFPTLVPFSPRNPAIEANRAAWAVYGEWTKPFITAFSDGDPVTAGRHKRFQRDIPGAQGQPHTTIEGAGHFLQEQAPDRLASVVLGVIESANGASE